MAFFGKKVGFRAKKRGKVQKNGRKIAFCRRKNVKALATGGSAALMSEGFRGKSGN
jgi:hypothetical protein